MNTPGKLFILFSIIISLSCRAGEKSDQSAPRKVIDDPSGAKVARRAAQGDTQALKKFFGFTGQLDGAGAEEHCGVVGKVIHIIGDDGFAEFLRVHPEVQVSINDEVTYPFESAEYLRRHFPKTSKILRP